jgi:hypothetical protein
MNQRNYCGDRVGKAPPGLVDSREIDTHMRQICIIILHYHLYP